MVSANSENSKKGRDFENKVKQVLERKYSKEKFEKKFIKIGVPPKLHEFDLVSKYGNIIVECKKYSWTKSGGIPYAKKAYLNEAVLYLSLAPKNTKKIIVLSKSSHFKRKESFAEYYVRTCYNLLNKIIILELDVKTGLLKEIK